jgi:hypothetical protein
MNTVAVLKATSAVFGVSVEEMCMRSRQRQILHAREVAMYILRKRGGGFRSYADIGRDFDNRTHATVLNAVNRIEKLLPDFSEQIEQIVAEVSSQGEAVRYNMQLGVELRCGKCQERFVTGDIAECACTNLRILRTQDPFTEDVCAIAEAEDNNAVEARRRDGAWVPLLEAIHPSVEPPHIGQATELMMQSAIDFWNHTRETHKKKADTMPPLLYWKQYNTLILGFPRISGNTTAAVKLATERGLFAYVARHHEVMEYLRERYDGKDYRGVFTCPETMDEDLRGLEPMTFVFDGVIQTPAEWDEMLEFCTICAAAMDHTEVLILRVGEAI